MIVPGHFTVSSNVSFVTKVDEVEGILFVSEPLPYVRVRSFNNDYQRRLHDDAPIGYKRPLHSNVLAGTQVKVEYPGRNDDIDWVFDRLNGPSVSNQATYRVFTSAVPVIKGTVVDSNLRTAASKFYERFWEWYPVLTGDYLISPPISERGRSPFSGSMLVELENVSGQRIDDVCFLAMPERIDYDIFQVDPEVEEGGSTATRVDDQSLIVLGHYTSQESRPHIFHTRTTTILRVAKEAQDDSLVVLMLFPVFESFVNEWIIWARNKYISFNQYVERKLRKKNILSIEDKINFLIPAICAAGYNKLDFAHYVSDAHRARVMRNKAVHEAEVFRGNDLNDYINFLVRCVVLMEHVRGGPVPFNIAEFKAAGRSAP